MTNKQKMQADGAGGEGVARDGASDAVGKREGGGESGGGAYPKDAPHAPGAQEDGKPAPAADDGKPNKP